MLFFTDIAACRPCQGNIDFKDSHPTHHSKECDIVVGPNQPITAVRCKNCSTYRGTLRKARWRVTNAPSSAAGDRLKVNSKASFSSLKNDELIDRCRNINAAKKVVIRENVDLKSKIVQIIEQQSINCSQDAINNICDEAITDRVSKLPNGSVQKLFLEEQLKASSVKANGRRWHPTILRWCLIMHQKSKSLYRYMRESGFVCLPSERTLSDYRCYRDINSGVDPIYIHECSKKFGKQDVAILIDEMKIQEGLVYNVSTGDLHGFVDSVDADALLDDVTANVLSSQNRPQPLATHALSFMMRGLKSSLQAVVATYATHCLTAKMLLNRFWDTVSEAELAGFRVRSCVSDGASINRKFYKLHALDFPDDPVTHRAINSYAKEPRFIYFISDTCHLMKTTRNGLENSGGNRNSRRLVVGNTNRR